MFLVLKNVRLAKLLLKGDGIYGGKGEILSIMLSRILIGLLCPSLYWQITL